MFHVNKLLYIWFKKKVTLYILLFCYSVSLICFAMVLFSMGFLSNYKLLKSPRPTGAPWREHSGRSLANPSSDVEAWANQLLTRSYLRRHQRRTLLRKTQGARAPPGSQRRHGDTLVPARRRGSAPAAPRRRHSTNAENPTNLTARRPEGLRRFMWRDTSQGIAMVVECYEMGPSRPQWGQFMLGI